MIEEPENATDLDASLRRALRRVEAPDGFADRVRQRLDAPAAARPPGVTAGRVALAATLVLAAAGGAWYRAEEQRREQGEQAKRQVLLSLSIAGSRLKAIELKINRGGQREP